MTDEKTKLDSNQWSKMPLAKLYDQELLLQSKIDIARNLGNIPLESQLVRGLSILQEFINVKKDKDDPITIIR